MSCNNKRISIFRAREERPYWHVKNKIAKELVARGKAVYIDDRSIRLIEPVQVVTSSILIRKSSQGSVYESAAVDPRPRVFQGGLTRTEHGPRPFDRWAGAKVGHQ